MHKGEEEEERRKERRGENKRRRDEQRGEERMTSTERGEADTHTHTHTPSEPDAFCERAITLIVDLCLDDSPLLDVDTCEEFLLLLTTHRPNSSHSGKHTTAGCVCVCVCVREREKERERVWEFVCKKALSSLVLVVCLIQSHLVVVC